MEHAIYLSIILLGGVAAFCLWLREHFARERAQEEKSEIEGEEKRFFDFLRGLGERLQEDNSSPAMHRFIVDGVVEVVGADAGILYLLDEGTGHLVPTCQSSEAAPVLPVPEEIESITDAEAACKQYRSYIRLSALPPDASLLWRSMDQESPLYVQNLLEAPEFRTDSERFHRDVRFLAAPLVYGRKRIGLLAVTRTAGAFFTENDRGVFGSIADQSAFALGSALVYGEASEKRRLERELTQASEIQRVLLPRRPPALVDYGIAAVYNAARIVSGDYYDYLRVDDERYGIAIGDVCGKGIAASLIMAMCRSNLRGRAKDNLSPAAVLHEVNRSIFPDIREDMFVSLLYLILERGSGEVTLARAGHEPPVLFRKESGTVELLEPSGMAAGIDRGPVFKRSVKDHRFPMHPGDVLLLYTDGVVEAEGADGEEYGIERLMRSVERLHEMEAEKLVAAIVDELDAFSSGNPQIDDITLIAIAKR